MKKIATRFVLATASTFMLATAMAQTDTTKTPAPEPDTTKVPTDTTSVPEPTVPTEPTEPPDTTTTTKVNINAGSSASLAMELNKLNSNLYVITDKDLLNSKQYDIKAEEENEA